MATIEKALEKIRDITMGLRQAARIYGISVTTLSRHFENPRRRTVRGKPPIISAMDEQMLEDMLITCSHFRVGLSKIKFLAVIADLAKEKGVEPHESHDSDTRVHLPYTFFL
jgi:hypothetical protein